MTSSSQILARLQQGIITPEQAEKMLDDNKKTPITTPHISIKPEESLMQEDISDTPDIVGTDVSLSALDLIEKVSVIKEPELSSIKKQGDGLFSPILAQLTVAHMIGWIGGLMLGVGVIWLVAENRDYWSDFAKMIILIGSMLLSYLLGCVLIQHDIKGVGYAMILVGGLIYGANVFLIGQMYNIGGNYHEGLLLWWLGLVPLAYATGLVRMLFFSLLVFCVWLISWLVDIDQMQVIVFYIGAVGLVFLSLGRPNRRYYPQFESTYRVWGFVFVYLSFFLLTVGHWTYLRGLGGLQFHSILIGMILLSVLIKLLTREHSDSEIKNFALIVHAGVLTTVYFLILGQGPMIGDGFVVMMDALLSAYFVGMIVYSILLQMPHAHTSSGSFLINLNMLFLVGFVVIQYVNIVGNRLEGSVFFISTGVVLLVTAGLVELWRKRILATPTTT